MMINAKVLVFSDNKKEKAIINFKEKEDSEIKFFNFDDCAKKNYALGIKQGEKVIKIPLNIKNNYCKFSLQDIDLKKNILCAVVDVTNAFCPEIILSGSANSTIENETIENCFVVKKPEDTSKLYEIDEMEDIENTIDKNLKDDLNSTYYDNCAKCKYRQAFYNDEENCCKFENFKKEVSSLNYSEESKEENLNKDTNKCELKNEEEKESEDEEKEIVENKDGEFYLEVKEQIDKLFNKYEEENTLKLIVENSKWVKINYDSNSSFYVLGLIFDDVYKDKVKFISYGIPSNNSEVPPEDLKDFAQWLPISNNSFDYKGYWLVYQSAENGETIKVDFI